jgi:hypothetical protein
MILVFGAATWRQVAPYIGANWRHMAPSDQPSEVINWHFIFIA